MIIWINGPYGVGKSTLAEKLLEEIHPSFLFDAELVGDAVRGNLPDQLFKETYEEFPIWLEFCRRLLQELVSCYEGCVIVPMTLMRTESVEFIIDGLKSSGVNIKHILLEASTETVRERILLRGEDEDCWCMQQIEHCEAEQRNMKCDLRLLANDSSPEKLADLIVAQINH